MTYIIVFFPLCWVINTPQMVEDWFTAEDVDLFCKTLPSPDPETGLGNDLSDGGSDDIKLIE